MQFNTQADRIAAIKKACEELGQAYGEMKFKEHMLTEFKQSFVPNTTANEQVAQVAAPAPVEAKAEAPAPKAKAKAAPKKADVQTELETTTKVVEAKVEAPALAPAPATAAPTTAAPTTANACPISTATELRDLMLKRFNESGRSTEMQMALKAAVLESTGCDAAMKVPAEKIAAAYDAVMAVEV